MPSIMWLYSIQSAEGLKRKTLSSFKGKGTVFKLQRAPHPLPGCPGGHLLCRFQTCQPPHSHEAVLENQSQSLCVCLSSRTPESATGSKEGTRSPWPDVTREIHKPQQWILPIVLIGARTWFLQTLLSDSWVESAWLLDLDCAPSTGERDQLRNSNSPFRWATGAFLSTRKYRWWH